LGKTTSHFFQENDEIILRLAKPKKMSLEFEANFLAHPSICSKPQLRGFQGAVRVILFPLPAAIRLNGGRHLFFRAKRQPNFFEASETYCQGKKLAKRLAKSPETHRKS